jgi:hypothetical protein
MRYRQPSLLHRVPSCKTTGIALIIVIKHNESRIDETVLLETRILDRRRRGAAQFSLLEGRAIILALRDSC